MPGHADHVAVDCGNRVVGICRADIEDGAVRVGVGRRADKNALADSVTERRPASAVRQRDRGRSQCAGGSVGPADRDRCEVEGHIGFGRQGLSGLQREREHSTVNSGDRIIGISRCRIEGRAVAVGIGGRTDIDALTHGIAERRPAAAVRKRDRVGGGVETDRGWHDAVLERNHRRRRTALEVDRGRGRGRRRALARVLRIDRDRRDVDGRLIVHLQRGRQGDHAAADGLDGIIRIGAAGTEGRAVVVGIRRRPDIDALPGNVAEIRPPSAGRKRQGAEAVDIAVNDRGCERLGRRGGIDRDVRLGRCVIDIAGGRRIVGTARTELRGQGVILLRLRYLERLDRV